MLNKVPSVLDTFINFVSKLNFRYTIIAKWYSCEKLKNILMMHLNISFAKINKTQFPKLGCTRIVPIMSLIINTW